MRLMRSPLRSILLRVPVVAAVLLTANCDGDAKTTTLTPEPEAPVTPLVFPDEPFRAMRPLPAAATAFAPPRPETFQLDNGLQVFLVERATIPHVSWYLTFPGGSQMDPPDKQGLASLCLNVSFQSNGTISRQGREHLLADMGADVNLNLGSNEVTWFGESRQSSVNDAAALWMNLFLAPDWDPSDFEGTKRVRLTTLSAGPSQDPPAVASRVSSRLYWGREHPFNQTITAQSLQRITLPDCFDFFARVVRPMGAKLFVSGAINRAQLTLAFARLATLAGGAAMSLPPSPATPVPGKVFFVHAPRAPQSIITIRGRGPSRTSPDYHAAETMAEILAGSTVSSRIGLNVREMRGYAYSTFGSFTYTPAGGSFFFSAPVRADATVESLQEVLEEVRKMREAGATIEELERESRGRLAGLPYLFETAGATLAEYYFLDTLGVPFTYFDTYAQDFAAVTPAATQQAAMTYLAPDTLQTLIVGDRSTVLEKLRALVATRPDLMGSEVIHLDGEGNPAP
jgi:zinc protease